MKLLFFSCLIFLLLNLHAKASEIEDELIPAINNASILQKEVFSQKLFIISKEEKICPKLLFSLGLDYKWDKIQEKEYEKELRYLAKLVKNLN